MLPRSLALIDDDSEYSEFLAEYLRGLGVRVEVFGNSASLLVSSEAYDFEFYVVDLSLPDIDGVSLIQVLRQRTNLGLLVVSGRLSPEVFSQVVQAGADMYLAKPVQFEQVAVAIKAINRRAQAIAAPLEWVLDRRSSQLVAPDGARVDLSPADLTLVECFVAAQGGVVLREEMRKRLGRTAAEQGGTDAITAMIYRLRRRIERATSAMVPLQSRSRLGYEFKAPLKAV